MKKRYFSSVKQYGWIILACTLLALIAGFFFVKIQPQVYQVSSTMYVVANAPANTFDPSLSANDSVGLATNYASQIISRSVMEYVYQSDPQIKSRGYGPDDLLADVTTTPSATASTVLITASALNANDAVLMANDVAKGFQAYIQTQRQQQLDSLRNSLQSQYTTVQKQKSATEGSIIALASTTDPHYSVYNAELNDEIHTLDSIQTQLLTLPTTTSSNIITIQFAATKDAIPALKSNQIIAITAGIGLLIGTFIMLLLIYRDKRLRSGEQVREELGMAYLGGISKSSELAANPTQVIGVVAHEIADICANLRLTGVLPERGSVSRGVALLVTSARSTEGKTVITAALAAAMAQGGSSVIVVDGNIRQPALHLAFGMQTTGSGLSGLLKFTNGESVDAYVMRSTVSNVWLLPAGSPMDDPMLLLGQKMTAILSQLRSKVDVVLIDGPALLSGAEANVLASMVDGVALVADTKHDKLPLLQRAREILNALTHTPAGVILNRLPRQNQDSYYVSRYSSGNTSQESMWIPVHAVNGSNSNHTQKPEPELAPPGSVRATVPVRPNPVSMAAGVSSAVLSLPSRYLDRPSPQS